MRDIFFPVISRVDSSPHVPAVPTSASALRRWLTDRAASVDRLRLVPKHAVPAGKLAPV